MWYKEYTLISMNQQRFIYQNNINFKNSYYFFFFHSAQLRTHQPITANTAHTASVLLYFHRNIDGVLVSYQPNTLNALAIVWRTSRVKRRFSIQKHTKTNRNECQRTQLVCVNENGSTSLSLMLVTSLCLFASMMCLCYTFAKTVIHPNNNRQYIEYFLKYYFINETLSDCYENWFALGQPYELFNEYKNILLSSLLIWLLGVGNLIIFIFFIIFEGL